MSGQFICEKACSNVLSNPLSVLVDAQEMKDPAKSPDHIERLACKYMVTFSFPVTAVSVFRNW